MLAATKEMCKEDEMRKYAVLIAITAMILLLFSGCTGNLFMEWDRPEVASAAEMNDKADNDPDGLLSDIEDYLEGGTVDEENADNVLTALNTVYNNETGDTKAQAALLMGEVALEKDENAGEFVNNVGNAVDQIEGIETEDDAMNIIKSLVPDGVLADETAFSDMISSLVESADGYLKLGTELDSGTIDTDSFMEAGDYGTTTQQGVITAAVTAVLDSLDGTLGNLDSGDTIDQTDIDTLYGLVNGTDTWDSGSYADPTTVFDGTVSGYEGVDDLLALSNVTI